MKGFTHTLTLFLQGEGIVRSSLQMLEAGAHWMGARVANSLSGSEGTQGELIAQPPNYFRLWYSTHTRAHKWAPVSLAGRGDWMPN